MTERELSSGKRNLERAIVALEAQRNLLGDEVVEAGIAAIHRQIAEQKPVQSLEQRKHITILYAGLSGFSSVSESMDVENVGQVMRTYMDTITPVIIKHGGLYKKSIGDSVMAVFGLPQAHENDPENSIRAALEMQHALTELNFKKSAEWGFDLRMRIGINTGQVIARYFGAEQEQDFTVILFPQ